MTTAIPFYGGKTEKSFLKQNYITFYKEFDRQACLFAENKKVYFLDYTAGLFYLHERQIRVLTGAARLSRKVLQNLDWQQVQFLKRTSQTVVANYFQHYAELLDNFPEMGDYETFIAQAEDYQRKTPVSRLSAQYFWKLVEAAFIFPHLSFYSASGVIFDLHDTNWKLTPGRLRKQLGILQEHDFLHFRQIDRKIFEVRFNRQALHIDFKIAPRFFRMLTYATHLPELETADFVEEPPEKYQPKKRNPALTSEAMFLEKYKNQLRLGRISEEKVLAFEQNALADFPELAQKVRSVADDPSYGFDLISFEPDGTEKQIEVKTVRQEADNQAFFISRNELEKSRTLPNYYLYCVSNPHSEQPVIRFFKQPDLDNPALFQLEARNFEVSFRLNTGSLPEE
jgi:Domain of unknown function (DUF3883)